MSTPSSTNRPGILDPYAGVDWSAGVRGNLHCHSTRSDGAASPKAVVDRYAAEGYGFLMLSDHDCFGSPDELAAIGRDDLVLISGCEISARGGHVLQVGGTRAADPVEERQDCLDAIAADGGLAILNHPNWLQVPEVEHWPLPAMRRLDRYAGIEIYNALIAELAGSPYATLVWDRLLSDRRLLWGYVNDDAHALSHVARGWMIAFPETRDARGVQAALARGRFYGSSGLTITSVTVDGNRARCVSADAQRVAAIGTGGQRLAVVDGPALTVDLPKMGYVRFECWGGPERQAWTQPIWIGW